MALRGFRIIMSIQAYKPAFLLNNEQPTFQDRSRLLKSGPTIQCRSAVVGGGGWAVSQLFKGLEYDTRNKPKLI